jgi:repeat-companion domain TIGR02996
MNDFDNFIRAICLAPEDDAPRLIFADWLDENDGSMACPKCGGHGTIVGPFVDGVHEAGKILGTDSSGRLMMQTECVFCLGLGPVPNGYAARAEFIRLQIEDGETLVYNDAWPLTTKPEELLRGKGHNWMGQTYYDNGIGRRALWRRGFIDEIHCTLADFMAHAQDITLRQPVRRWVLTNVEAEYEYDGEREEETWSFFCSSQYEADEPWDDNDIPWGIHGASNAPRWKHFRSSLEAYDWLQQRCYECARQKLLASVAITKEGV